MLQVGVAEGQLWTEVVASLEKVCFDEVVVATKMEEVLHVPGCRGIYTPGVVGASMPADVRFRWCSGDILQRRPQLKFPAEIFTVAAQ